MCSAHLVFHFAPRGMFFRSIKQVSDASGNAKHNEVSETEQRDQNADLIGNATEIIQKDPQEGFSKADAGGRDR